VDSPSWVNVIEKTGNIKEEKGAHMSYGTRALDLVNQGGYSIDGAVMRSGPKLGHRKEVEVLDVDIDAFGDDLL